MQKKIFLISLSFFLLCSFFKIYFERVLLIQDINIYPADQSLEADPGVYTLSTNPTQAELEWQEQISELLDDNDQIKDECTDKELDNAKQRRDNSRSRYSSIHQEDPETAW